MRPKSGVNVDYRAATAEELADAGEKFDVILNMEVVEHVADVGLFVARCAEMVKPDGIMFVATINRTLKALGPGDHRRRICAALAAASGTHQYGKLVRPDELEKALAEAGMTIADRTGVIYNPLSDRWQRSRDMDVNYMVLAEKEPAASARCRLLSMPARSDLGSTAPNGVVGERRFQCSAHASHVRPSRHGDAKTR